MWSYDLSKGTGKSDLVQWGNSPLQGYVGVTATMENAVVRKVFPFQGYTVVFRK
jgi:hypothetical protein